MLMLNQSSLDDHAKGALSIAGDMQLQLLLTEEKDCVAQDGKHFLSFGFVAHFTSVIISRFQSVV